MKITVSRFLYKPLFFFALVGCYKNHLYVQQEWVDAGFLASTVVKTPDPRQKCPPHGQRLLIAWGFPRSLFDEKLVLRATVRLADHTQKEIFIPLERKRGSCAQFFPSEKPGERAILTYKVDVLNESGAILESWKHQFWTELVECRGN